MGKFSKDIVKLFEEFKRQTEEYQDLDLEKVEFEEKELKNIADKIKAGGTPKTSENRYWADDFSLIDNQEYFGWRDINKELFSNIYIDKVSKVITKEGLNKSSTWLVPEGSILLAIASNSKGLLTINKVPMCINQNILGIVLDKSKYDVRYVYFFLKNHYSKIIQKGFGNLTKASESKIKILIPKSISEKCSSYEIQKAIADFIEFISLKSDDIVDLMEEIIEKAEKGKEHLLYKIFESLPNGKITEDVINLFNEFKKEKGYQDLNLEDLEFEDKKLIDFGDGEGICYQRMGFTPKTAPDGDIYFFKVGDLSKVEGLEIIEPQTEEMTKMEYVDKALGKKSKKRIPIQKGEILVSFKLTVGVSKIYNSDKLAYCNEAIDILTPKEDYYNKYLALIVGKKYQEQANAETVKGKSLNEDLKDLIYVPIPKPYGNYTSYQIQKIIAEFIEFSFENYLKLIQKIKKESDFLEKMLIRKFFNSIISNEENE